MRLLNVQFLGPFAWWNRETEKSVFSEIQEKDIKSGIYLRTFKKDKKYYVFFVGESENLGKRFEQHFSLYMSGLYSMYEPKLLDEIKRKEVLSKRWNDTTYPDYFMNNYQEVTKKNYQMMEKMKIFIAQLEKDDLKTVETMIILQLQNTSDQQTKNFLANKRKIRNLKDLKIKYQSNVYIEGLT